MKTSVRKVCFLLACLFHMRGKVNRYKRFKLTFYNFLGFREESRHMLKLLDDKCICFCAGEKSLISSDDSERSESVIFI